MKSGTPFRFASSDAFESGSPSVVWPSESSTIADGGAPRSSVSTCRTASPSRDWLPWASIASSFAIAPGTSVGPIDLGQGLRRVRDQVDPHLVLLFQLPDQPRAVLGQIRPLAMSSRVVASGSPGAGLLGLDRRGERLERRLDLRLLVLVGDPLARRIIDQDRHVGQPRPRHREHGLREHEHRQQHQRHPHRRQKHLGRRDALPSCQ